jgi:hypothetical protein
LYPENFIVEEGYAGGRAEVLLLVYTPAPLPKLAVALSFNSLIVEKEGLKLAVPLLLHGLVEVAPAGAPVVGGYEGDV